MNCAFATIHHISERIALTLTANYTDKILKRETAKKQSVLQKMNNIKMYY